MHLCDLGRMPAPLFLAPNVEGTAAPGEEGVGGSGTTHVSVSEPSPEDVRVCRGSSKARVERLAAFRGRKLARLPPMGRPIALLCEGRT